MCLIPLLKAITRKRVYPEQQAQQKQAAKSWGRKQTLWIRHKLESSTNTHPYKRPPVIVDPPRPDRENIPRASSLSGSIRTLPYTQEGSLQNQE
jgi:hypothetical protein